MTPAYPRVDAAPVLPPLPAAGSLTWRATVAGAVAAAWRGIAAYKLRSALTMLGLVVGVAGVVVIAAFGRFTGAMLAAQNAALGANLISVDSAPPTVNGVQTGADDTLTEADAQAAAKLPHVVAVSVTLTPHMGLRSQVVAGGRNWSAMVLGVYPEGGLVQGAGVAEGAYLSAQDEASAAPSAVLGATVASRLFPEGGAVGRRVRVDDAEFAVVGVLRPQGAASLGTDPDDVVYVPFSTAQRRVRQARRIDATPTFASMLLKVDDAANAPAVVAAATRAIDQNHHVAAGAQRDFRVGGFEQAAAQAQQSVGLIRLVMSGIAGLVLLLGGFGVANVMLASVAGRTREIGVRMAVGAQRRDVLLQFVCEAAALSLLGGLVGIAAGFALIALLVQAVPLINGFGVGVVPGADAVAVALLVSAAVGVAFGYLPARRAAGLDPVRALRHV